MGVSSSQGAVERLKALRGEEDREREVEGGGRPQAAGGCGGWQCGGDQTDGVGVVGVGGGWPLKYTEECTIHKHLTCL